MKQLISFTILFCIFFCLAILYLLYPYYQSWHCLEKGLEILINRYNIHGVDAACLENGDLIYNNQFGYAELKNGGQGVLLDATHHMRAESISKTVAAAAVLHLTEHRDIELSDPIYEHIDFRLPPAGKNGPGNASKAGKYDPGKITIAHILSHQSGITGGSDYSVPAFEIPPREEVLAGLHNLDPAVMVRNAGEKFEYSNQAFILLEILIEQNSDKTYEEYVKTHLFEPLSLMKSTYEYPEDTIITSYDLNGVSVPRHRYPFSAPGGLYTDAREIMIFYHNLFNGNLISSAGIRALTENRTEAAGFYALGTDGVGLGLFLDGDGIFHGGEGSGSLSMAFYQPETGSGFVIMTNDKTAWEFLYTGSALMARHLGEDSPKMSALMFIAATGFYAFMALLTVTVHYYSYYTCYIDQI